MRTCLESVPHLPLALNGDAHVGPLVPLKRLWMGSTLSLKPQVSLPVSRVNLLSLCNAHALASEEASLPPNYANSEQEAVRTKPSDLTQYKFSLG